MTMLAVGLTGLVVVAGAWRVRPNGLRRLAGRWARGGAGRSVAIDQRTFQWVVAGVAAFVGLTVSGPLLAVVFGGGAAASGPLAARHRARRRRVAVAAAVPDLIDLFLVSASAGQPVAGSLLAVAPRAPAAVAPMVASAADRFRHGLPLAESLSGLGADLGPGGAPLADALGQAASAGVPLVPLLEGVAATARDQRRRRAQEVARRLPVTMLLPLVACILPAAILLAVVPVLLVSVASLSP